MLSEKTIGCIGTGNMGSTIISGLSSRLKKEKIVAFDANSRTLESVKLKYGVIIADNIIDLTKKCDVIILAVKPDVVSTVVNELKDVVANKIIISIAAGVTISSIEDVIRSPQSIIRVMPNTPALIGKGISVLSPNELPVAVQKTLFDDNTSNDLKIGRKKYIEYSLYEFDGKSSIRVKNLIEKILNI